MSFFRSFFFFWAPLRSFSWYTYHFRLIAVIWNNNIVVRAWCDSFECFWCNCDEAFRMHTTTKELGTHINSVTIIWHCRDDGAEVGLLPNENRHHLHSLELQKILSSSTTNKKKTSVKQNSIIDSAPALKSQMTFCSVSLPAISSDAITRWCRSGCRTVRSAVGCLYLNDIINIEEKLSLFFFLSCHSLGMGASTADSFAPCDHSANRILACRICKVFYFVINREKKICTNGVRAEMKLDRHVGQNTPE